MKVALIFLLSVTLISSHPSEVVCQVPFEKYDSKDTLINDVNRIISDFDKFMRDQGINPPFVPSVTVNTAPFLIKWDGPTKSVILPYWDELPNEHKEFFIGLQGENAEEFFISLFNWFFVPHELGHFMLKTNEKNYGLSPFEDERAADEFAIAFLINNVENREKITFIEESLQEVLKKLPEIDFNNLSEEEYFNTNYTNLGRNPSVYGYFQFNFILDILNNKEEINILEYFN